MPPALAGENIIKYKMILAKIRIVFCLTPYRILLSVNQSERQMILVFAHFLLPFSNNLSDFCFEIFI